MDSLAVRDPRSWERPPLFQGAYGFSCSSSANISCSSSANIGLLWRLVPAQIRRQLP